LLLLAATIIVEVIWRWEHVLYAARTNGGRWLERWARRHDL
jgi:hypothetical protein